jgi:hypothetical protein
MCKKMYITLYKAAVKTGTKVLLYQIHKNIKSVIIGLEPYVVCMDANFQPRNWNLSTFSNFIYISTVIVHGWNILIKNNNIWVSLKEEIKKNE